MLGARAFPGNPIEPAFLCLLGAALRRVGAMPRITAPLRASIGRLLAEAAAVRTLGMRGAVL